MPRRLSRAQWPSYVDAYARGAAHQRGVFYGELRIFDTSERPSLQPRWLPVRAITFDQSTGELDASIDHLGDIRRRPLRLVVDDGADGVIRVEVTRSDGLDEIIELR